jgi:diketogulonate reductase-like aldo/keto reductase
MPKVLKPAAPGDLLKFSELSAPLPKAAGREHYEENLDVFDFELDMCGMSVLGGLNERDSSLAGLPYL